MRISRGARLPYVLAPYQNGHVESHKEMEVPPEKYEEWNQKLWEMVLEDLNQQLEDIKSIFNEKEANKHG